MEVDIMSYKIEPFERSLPYPFHIPIVTSNLGKATQSSTDDLGRVTKGVVQIKYGSAILVSSSNYIKSSLITNIAQRAVTTASNSPLAVLAIPVNWGCTNVGQNISWLGMTGYEYIHKALEPYVSYVYVLLSGNSANISLDDGLGANKKDTVPLTYNTAYYGDKLPDDWETEYGNTSNVQVKATALTSRITVLSEVVTWLNNQNKNGKFNTIEPWVIEAAEQFRNNVEYVNTARTISVFSTRDWLTETQANLFTNTGLNTTLNFLISGSIASSIPVFSIDNQENLIKYFETGDTSGADNALDMAISKIGMATDWKIYVKGRRYPDLWITMESKELNNYLESEDNAGGWQKNNFTVQYRYETIKLVHTPGDIRPMQERQEPTSVSDTTPYDETATTSFKQIAKGVYGQYYDEAYALMESDFYEYHVNLQFRLYKSPDIFSQWCYFDIGLIGSPSISDFKKMNNTCGGIGLSDGSTVELIYDMFPDDIDGEYKDPDNDSDIKGGGDDDEQSGDNTLPDRVTLASTNLLTTSYRVSNANVQLLGGKLWSSSFWDNIKLLNNSPIENIVGLKIMPCAVNSYTSEITIGNVNMEIDADVITSVPIVNVGSIKFDGYYKNFLDYAPYTQAILFLPFIGFVEIDPAQYTGHTLNVRYSFDIVMGQCKAMLFADGIYCQSYEGTCGIDVPLVASNRAQVEGALIGGALSSIGGDLISAIGNMGASYLTRQYHSTRNGGYSSTLGWAETRNVYLVLIIPNAQYSKSYGHDIGFPCNLTCQLGTLSGFTVCGDNIDMSGFSCTEEEKAMIKEMLTTGVYL